MPGQTKVEGTEWDFIVCGGGTSGCVVAARLAENPNTKVLVIEAGPHSEGMETVDMPGGWAKNLDKETDWNIATVPGANINNRQVKLARAKFLGGCSGLNATLCIRGTRQDYDDWGVPGWNGEEFFQYMKKSESFQAKTWFNASEGSHGTDGLLKTEPHELAPISDLIIESLVDKGLPLDHDIFSHGKSPNGVGHAIRTVVGGVRTTSADFISKANARDNVTILTGAHVEKVLIEEEDAGELKAVGVKSILADGTAFEAKATKEVIVSGGSYCSPLILNRSGIGAKAELEPHGIKTLVELPGVGKNLMDHLIVFMYYEANKPGITTDALIHHEGALVPTYMLWKKEKKGFLSAIPFGCFAYARLDSRLADSPLWNQASRLEGRDPMGLLPTQPNVELFNLECYGGPRHYTDVPRGGQHVFSMVAELFGARSRGSVVLKNSDAKEPPVVDGGYLSDPLDVEVLAEACRFANEVVTTGKGTKDVVKGPWPPGATHDKFSTREDWVPFVREHATTCYHGAGTCKMGRAEDEGAVVDERLRVRGVKGLRVADCSIIPVLGGYHTQMPAYGIAEKAADMIKEDWGLVP